MNKPAAILTPDLSPSDASRKERDFTSAILDVAAALVVVLDRQGRIVRFNRACEQTTGYKAREVLGKHVWDMLLPTEEVEPVRAVFDRIRAGRFPSTYENDWVARDGTRRRIAWSNTALLDEDGDVEYVIGTGIDITERRQAEQEKARLEELLHQVQKTEAVGQLACGVAHDFNNLLTVILHSTDRLKKCLDDNPKARESLDAIEQAAQQATSVTRSLLAFSSEVPTETKPVHLGAAVNELTGLLRRTLPAAIQLIVDSPIQAPLWIDADATHLQQILLNLTLNARDAMPNGGTLCITAAPATQAELHACRAAGRPLPDSVCLTISDTGEGMSPDIQARIFEPCFTTKPRGQGTGLGLAMVHGLVERHGGHIDVQSEAGHGATFRIVFPRVQPPPRPDPGSDARVTPHGCGASVLLAEHEPHLRGLMAMALEARGYHVIQAEDGPAARSRQREHGPNLHALVIDADLPDHGVLAWLRDLRAAGVSTPAVLMTGGPVSDEDKCVDARTAWLRKPFEVHELGQLVADLLAEHTPVEARE